MNIISNTCVGAFSYDILKERYNNPFMWNVISYKDFLFLIKNYEKIDFDNIKIVKSNVPNHFDTFDIIIENNITVHYVHHHQDDKCTEITKRKDDGSVDIYYNDMENYILKKYKTRVNRMKKNKEAPIFVLNFSTTKDFKSYFTKDDLNDLLTNNDICKDIFIITKNNIKSKNKHIHIINDNSFNTKNKSISLITYLKNKNIIK